jgi:hypothetical protein
LRFSDDTAGKALQVDLNAPRSWSPLPKAYN